MNALHPRFWHSVSGLLMLSLLVIPHFAEAQTKRLSVDEAVELALSDSPQVRVADAQVDEAVAKQKVIRGRFGPMLRLEANAFYFNEAPSISGDFSFPDMSIDIDPENFPMPESSFDGDLLLLLMEAFGPLMDLGDSFSNMDDAFAGNQYDINVKVSVIQPLTPLYQVGLGNKIAKIGIDAARVGTESQRCEVAMKTREAFYRTLQARAGVKALQAAVTNVEAHVERARLFNKAELLGREDLLEAQVRLAQLRGQLLGAENATQLATAGLALTVGLAEDTALELVEPVVPPETSSEPSVEDLQAAALEGRPDLRSLRLRTKQAQGGVQIAKAAFIPEVSAMAVYQHNEGSLMETPAWTVGGIMSWNLWEWGSTYYGVDEARARVAAARAGLDGLERGIRLQVRQAYLALDEARERIRIAESTIGLAEEQLRLERIRFDGHIATSTDVLDAQIRLTRAQVEHDIARYNVLIAIAALRHATGQPEGGQ